MFKVFWTIKSEDRSIIADLSCEYPAVPTARVPVKGDRYRFSSDDPYAEVVKNVILIADGGVVINLKDTELTTPKDATEAIDDALSRGFVRATSGALRTTS